MYKNLSEIVSKDSCQMTVVQSTVVILQNHFFLVVSHREHFFRAQYYAKVVAVNHSSIDTLFLRRALATTNCIYKMNLTVCLRRIFISKEHLQSYIWVAPSFFQEASCSNLVLSTVLYFKEILTIIITTPWFQACIYLKKVCYMTTSFTVFHFFYDTVIISRQHLKQSTCQGNCLYFTTLFATIHHNKRSAVDSRKS